ncbi:phosphotransferase enzyme family protein [Mycolicibacterium obuense]|uniref:Homoserine kinase n=1 Tax=Mycolicibacterium obuense TaxID=1807 RepID=A0A0J6ZBE1_9MYCO|nr:phosphotransferase [Mycolicibacterium obuense]KMO81981.1 Homoserine kinase [Mycolicibacterium obuense]
MADDHTPVTASSVMAHAYGILEQALPRFGFAPGTPHDLLPVSENVAFRLRPPGECPSVLRISRPEGRSVRERESELAWITAIRAEAPDLVPAVLVSQDGTPLITVEHHESGLDYQVCVFECVTGEHPAEDDYATVMPHLGAITAQLHQHAAGWDRPAWFTRYTWDVDAAFGPTPLWGRWQAGVHDREELAQLTAVEDYVRRRLTEFGQGSDRFGLIHADLRATNLLIDGNDCRIIDFDDCGFGWLLYDLATAMTFIEDHPRAGEFIASWLEAYRSVRPLPVEHEREIDTFLLYRRLLTIAFLGNNPDIDVTREMLPGLARGTCEWAEGILRRPAASS